jgi:putative transposase
VKYACLAQHRAEYPVRMMCRVRAVSRAGCYAWLDRAPSRRAQGDVRLRVAIRPSHAESRLSYGRPRIHRERRAQGQCPGRKRIARLMQLEGRRAKRSRRYRATTRRDATRPAALRAPSRSDSPQRDCCITPIAGRPTRRRSTKPRSPPRPWP